MASVSDILDRASRITGLRTTGSERDIALAALQDAYGRAVMDAECNPTVTSYTFPTSSDDYSLLTMLTELPARLHSVSLAATGSNTPLKQTSLQELLEMRDGATASGTPRFYAVVGFERLALYPNPSVGDQVNVWYFDAVPELVETAPIAGQETTPSKLPVNFHWSVLLPATVLELLDKDQRLAESGMWNQRYMSGIGRLQEHIGQMGGQANRAWRGN